MTESNAAITPRVISALYAEAMLLAEEARAYFDRNGREDRMNLDPLARVGFSCESLKVTTRIMHVIAWLLTQKAIAAGEISERQAADPERRLSPDVESDEEVVAQLPEAALALVRASQDLYDRVTRLADSAEGDKERASPARNLLGRLYRSL